MAKTETGPETTQSGPAMTEWFRVGDVVSDGIRCQVGEVNAIDGDELEIVRPSGLTWWASKYHCRQASRRERETLETNRTLRLKALSARTSRPASSAEAQR
ncbi:hypothetical protein J7E87_10945 [Streptomyces sp. ISL-1]|uniref:hypothetical protein n=1 Tax=Streptomyces sp. ISL-1 TaxID=2817657 RepID=UPI001BE52577|nr:hypothetical protein [Streptomyces sp. ISL-1]MBT2389924.1 hypothetical protein [Streptomyces sp. ISL-1]